eukprot:gene29592-33412_t
MEMRGLMSQLSATDLAALVKSAKQKGVELLLVGECWSASRADDQEGADADRELVVKDPYNRRLFQMVYPTHSLTFLPTKSVC